MAIASLRTLAAQVPNWQNRLAKLVAEIKTRQTELSELEKSSQPSIDPPGNALAPAAADLTAAQREDTTDMNKDSATSAVSQNQTAQSAGPYRPIKAPKPEPVYFDGSMQKFFEDLVHFIAVSRNMMRKAKMAARVAQIKKMAQVEINDELNDGKTETHTLRFVSTRSRHLDAVLAPGTSSSSTRANRGSDIFDGLDKTLDLLQSTSELAAFQFLRDASNNKHIKTIKKILDDILETSTTELARLEREEPEMVRDADAAAMHAKRPLSMQRDPPAGAKSMEAPSKRQNTGQLVDSESIPSLGHMEVDVDALQNDEPTAPQIIHLPTNIPLH